MFEEKSEKSEIELETPKIENATEEIINSESLAEQKISEMQSGAVELEKDGMEQVETANDSIGLDAENMEMVQDELQVTEKMSGISDKAKELLKSAQSAMKKAVVFGMTAAAASGCAGKVDNKIDDLTGTLEIISSAKTLEVNDDLATGEKEKQPSYGEKTRDSLIADIESAAYLERLKKETNGDIEEAIIIQQERLKNIKNINFQYFNDLDTLNNAYNGNKLIFGNTPSDSKIGAFTLFPLFGGRPIIGITNDKIRSFVSHELSHVTDDSGGNIPEKTIEKIKENFPISDRIDSSVKEYYSQPTEILARKHAIDARMAELGIKEYKEDYNQGHFQQLLAHELDAIGVKTDEELVKFILSGGTLPEVIDFLEAYGGSNAKEDLKKMVRIFNEIADNEDNKDTSGHNVV